MEYADLKKIKNNNKKKSIFLVLSIILSLGISLAAIYYIYTYRDSRENELVSGLISLGFTENSGVINLTNTVPVIDDVGITNTPYEFTVTNTSRVPINAKIMLDVDNSTTINLGAVKYAFYIGDELITKDYIHDDLILYTYEDFGPGEVLNCKLVFWIDYYYETSGETFSAKIKAEGESFDVIATDPITVTFDMNGGGMPNLVYGLEDVGETTAQYNYIKYSISNRVIQVTGLRDGSSVSWGITPGRAYLESGKKYVFNCDTDGTWGSSNANGVGILWCLEGSCSTGNYFSTNRSSIEFTPTKTGTYHLRIDIHQKDQTNTFSNISVKEKVEPKQVYYNGKYGDLPTPTRDGYTFMGWFLKRDLSSSLNWEQGAILDADGTDVPVNSAAYSKRLRNKEYIEVLPNVLHKLSLDDTINQNKVFRSIYYYDSNKELINFTMILSNSFEFTTPSNCAYIRMVLSSQNQNDEISLSDIENVNIYLEKKVDNKTKIIDNKNHTLKAIWSQNT